MSQSEVLSREVRLCIAELRPVGGAQSLWSSRAFSSPRFSAPYSPPHATHVHTSRFSSLNYSKNIRTMRCRT